MSLKKVLLVLFALFFINAGFAEAADFEVNSETTYNISSNTNTSIEQQITILNQTTENYAKELVVKLSGTNPKNIFAKQGQKILKTEISENGLVIQLDQANVGLQNSQVIDISYQDESLVKKIGDVFEITIPKLSNPDFFKQFMVRINVPYDLGDLAYISPQPDNQLEQKDWKTFYFDKNSLRDSVNIAFGQSQVFSFDISYHLENPLIKNVYSEIAIPSDTSYQTVHYQSISPPPQEVKVDQDGNWLAVYKLSSRQRLDIKAIGFVEVFSSPIRKYSVTQEFLNKNLLKSKYWQTDDQDIKKLASELKTPENIYNYVVDNLKYDFNRVSPTSKRLGAKEILKNSDSAICTEFTDLFISLSRSAGIPAREVNGFAYADNSSLQPLSLVADVLHSWPEYWDFKSQVWVPVDPTWGNTTGGVDYFNKLDLKHFSFVKHGLSATDPVPPGSYKLGSNPQKDIYISFADLPQDFKPNVEYKIEDSRLFLNNTGQTSIYGLPVEVYIADEKVFEKTIQVIPPYAEEEINIQIPNGYKKDAKTMTIKIGEQILESGIPKDVFDYKYELLIISAISLIALVIISSLAIKSLRK